ncbi:12400_t:CDS:1, partial [Dentiscutata erythropus]
FQTTKTLEAYSSERAQLIIRVTTLHSLALTAKDLIRNPKSNRGQEWNNPAKERKTLTNEQSQETRRKD